MRVNVNRYYTHLLARGVAFAILGGLVSGCSSDSMRFRDGIYNSVLETTAALTGQNESQVQVADTQTPQAYPDDVDTNATGSIFRSRSTKVVPPAGVGQGNIVQRFASRVFSPSQQASQNLFPAPSTPNIQSSVVRRALVPAPVAQTIGAAETIKTASDSIDRMSVGSVSLPAVNAGKVTTAANTLIAPMRQPNGIGGWTGTGGTQVKLREGETIYDLSRRYGVPADIIMKVNGISNSRDVSSGQDMVIPTYVYSHKGASPVATTTAQTDRVETATLLQSKLPLDKMPAPQRSPRGKFALASNSPQIREREVSQGQNTNASAKQTNSNTRLAGQLAKSPRVYQVVAGDSLSAISRKTGVSTATIKAVNGIDSDVIRVGQKLVIPNRRNAPQVAQSIPKNVDRVVTGGIQKPVATTSVRDLEAQSNAKAPKSTGIAAMRWPVRGAIISQFGATSGAKKNDGVDISVPTGTPIKAAENGVVIYAGSGLKGLGKTVLVRHDNGLVTVYGHASSLKVSRGQKVRRGQDIARAGSTGNTQAPKLHFEVRKNSVPVNPQKYLP